MKAEERKRERGGGLITITLHIAGKPIAKRRPRFARRGNFTTTYNDQASEEERFLVEALQQVGQIEPLSGPLHVDCVFYMSRPKGHYGTGRNAGTLKKSAPAHHTSKPDIDNLKKFAFDALNRYLWRDDSQIVSVTAVKEYSEIPGTKLEIREL